MQKALIAALVSSLSLVSAPAYAATMQTVTMPVSSYEHLVRSLTTCPDNLEEQEGVGICRPTATTEIKTEVDVKSLPQCPNALKDQIGFGKCRPTSETELLTTPIPAGERTSYTWQDALDGNKSVKSYITCTTEGAPTPNAKVSAKCQISINDKVHYSTPNSLAVVSEKFDSAGTKEMSVSFPIYKIAEDKHDKTGRTVTVKLNQPQLIGQAVATISVDVKEKIDVKSLPTCPDSLEEQIGKGACRPTMNTELKTESHAQSMSVGTSESQGNNEAWGEGEDYAPSRGHSNTTTSSKSSKHGESHGTTSGESYSHGTSHGYSHGESQGVSESNGVSESHGYGISHGTSHGYSHGESYGENYSTGTSTSHSSGHSEAQGHNGGATMGHSYGESHGEGYSYGSSDCGCETKSERNEKLEDLARHH